MASSNSSSSGSSNVQLQHQQLEAHCELAWRLSDWGVADCIVAQQQQHIQYSSGTCSSAAAIGLAAAAADAAGHRGFQASVLSALQALHMKDSEGFTGVLDHACHQCVLQLAGSSTQSAAAVNPLLVKLRMLHLLRRGGSLQWPSSSGPEAAGAGAGVLRVSCASTPGEPAPDALLRQLLGPDYLPDGSSSAVEQLGPAQFKLCDQLLALQSAVTKVLGRPDALGATLQVLCSSSLDSCCLTGSAAWLGVTFAVLHAAITRHTANTSASCWTLTCNSCRSANLLFKCSC
jgi:hypothetical protein